ncbi:Histamine N-methyltransferase [Holothuria leucospilota]|uniref:Histamine N-methyltransferase n=1 Tax=Holothuria leucospilota TaxID=206669 RepID=A0A9Q1C8Y6_HOLLE|nr:Histamine N-methyltransferase [Holothuria leucospilota]
MSLRYLQNFPSHYWKSYRGLRDNFYECPLEYDIGNEAFQTMVVDVLPKQESLNALGIGSGQGELDCINMGRMLTRVSRIDNTVVEPSLEAIEVYKSLFSGDLSDRVTTSWYQETFQEYQKRRESSTGPTEKFHFISAVHSLYYTGSDGSSIGYLIDLLEKDGVLFIAIQNDESGFIKFFGKVAESYGPLYNNTTQGYTTSQVVKLLDADGRVTYNVVKNRHNIDVTACFEADSSKGSLVLDFLTHVVDFKSTISQNVLESLLDYLKSPDCSEILSDGRIIFHEDWDAIIITKK